MSGEESAWMWSIGLISFAFGLAAGYAIHFFLNPGNGRSKALETELEKLRQENSDYRNQVVQHFQRTSELVQDMTQSYRAVYEHLAGGSQQLCSEPINTPQLDLPERERLPGTEKIKAATAPAPQASREPETDDDYLGDAPYVPNLDPGEDDDSVNPGTGKPLP